MKKYLIWLLVPLLIGGCSPKSLPVEEKYATTFRLAESHPDNHPTTLADYEFARLVSEKSGGRIQIVVYNNKQLGEEIDVIEQVGFGAIDFARVSTGPLASYVPILNVIQLPYLYENSDHMWEVLTSDIGDYVLTKVDEGGYVGLAWMDGGARSFYNKTGPIITIDDIKGKNFRVMQSAMMTDMVEALGGKAIALPYGEVYSGIQTGLLDGAENNWPSYETSSHFEVAPYYSIDEHVRVPEILIASDHLRAQLSDRDFNIIMEAAKETQAYQRKLWQEEEINSRNRLSQKGVIINDVVDREAFSEAVSSIYDKYAGHYMELVEAIKAHEYTWPQTK